MILKILLVAGVIYVVYIMFFKKKPSIKAQERKTTHTDKQDANELVQCQSCGVYVELDEAILSNAKYYCSTECADKG